MKRWTIILFLLGVARIWAAEQDNITPPLPPSPVLEFRTWLRMSPENRKAALSDRPEESRKVLEAKLKEYEALPEKQRERKLCAVELHWYLQQLIALPKSERAQCLEQVDKKLRPVVEYRLKQWQQVEKNVGEEQKKQILGNLVAVKFVSSPQSIEPPMPVELEVQSRLRNFFQMSERDQQKALEHFAAGNPNEMISTLKAFRALPDAERDKCIRSFGQFATMSSAEQAEFLRNVERWQAMPKEERETWRELVTTMPPLPPDLAIPPLPNVLN